MSLDGCARQYLQPFPKTTREQYLIFLQDADYSVKITAFVCLHTAGCWLQAPIKSTTLLYMSALHWEVNGRPKPRESVGYCRPSSGCKAVPYLFTWHKDHFDCLDERVWHPLQSVEHSHYWAATTCAFGECKTWIGISVWHVGKGIRCLFDF